jgi:hypothetical protein
MRYLAIVWKDEEPTPHKDDRIVGVHVGQTEVTLEQLWKETPKQLNRRF